MHILSKLTYKNINSIKVIANYDKLSFLPYTSFMVYESKQVLIYNSEYLLYNEFFF